MIARIVQSENRNPQENTMENRLKIGVVCQKWAGWLPKAIRPRIFAEAHTITGQSLRPPGTLFRRSKKCHISTEWLQGFSGQYPKRNPENALNSGVHCDTILA
jgi:hypothetical protein